MYWPENFSGQGFGYRGRLYQILEPDVTYQAPAVSIQIINFHGRLNLAISVDFPRGGMPRHIPGTDDRI